MQGLWSRAVPTQSSCHCVSCLSTASGVTSRSASAASKRRLRIGNSVTALYTSIFAAATLADAKSKVERRQEWEEKIAAVKAEVDYLKDQDDKILESLQLERRTRRSSGLLFDRRLRSTWTFPPTTLSQYRPSQPTRSFHTDHHFHPAASAQIAECIPSEYEEVTETVHMEEISTKDDEDYNPDFAETEQIEYSDELDSQNGHLPEWVLRDSRRIKAIQTLALRQFGLRIILRPRIAHRYSGVRVNYPRDVRAARAMMPNTNPDSKYDDIIQEWTSSHPEQLQETQASLDEELTEILQSLADKQVSLDEAVLQIAINIFRSVDPDRTLAFGKLIQTFTHMHQNDLNDLLLRSLLPNMFTLPPSLITNILSFFRKSRNLRSMDLFLQMLAGNGWSVNLGPRGTLYKRKQQDGIELVKPPNNLKPGHLEVIYSELIASALLFDQPQRADAWFEIAKSHCSVENFNTLYSYLRFYSINQNWTQGCKVLRRAVDWLATHRDLPSDRVERLIVLMVHLCDSNKQKNAARAVIHAAIDSGFEPNIAHKQTDVKPITDFAFTRWRRAAEYSRPVKATVAETVNRPATEKYLDFARVVGDYLTGVEGSLRRKSVIDSTSQPNQAFGDGNVAFTSVTSQVEKDNEIFALRNEVARMRELLAKIRKDQIEGSFNQDPISEPLNIQYKDEDEPAVPPPPASTPSSSTTKTEAEPLPAATSVASVADKISHSQTTQPILSGPSIPTADATASEKLGPFVQPPSPTSAFDRASGYRSHSPAPKQHNVTYDRVPTMVLQTREPLSLDQKSSSSARRRARKFRVREENTAILTISPTRV
ncbi:hypothetical protein N7470_008432 [Penicillium chermesinum]|nr:hypothetical protein N7470_008432 [Penicillium chermesinum]